MTGKKRKARQMITRKIARSGMRGRRKTTLLLVLVLAFTFLFIVAAILLETSMTETKKQQRRQLYGTWHAAYMEASPEICEQLGREPEVTRMTATLLFGEDKAAGMVGTISPELAEMGNMKLIQGRLPEAADEILVEASAADRIGVEKPVGETIRLQIKKPMVSEDLIQCWMQQAFEGGSLYRKKLYDVEKNGNLKLILNSQYSCVAEAQQVKDAEFIQKNGILFEQDLEIRAEYKIVGVIQSYAVFWDVGTYELPNVFLSEAGGKQMADAIHNTELLDLSDYVIPADVFMESDTLGENLRGELAETYEDGEKEEADSKRRFRRNLYAYPEAGAGSEATVTFLVIMVIFAVAFCAVLQIFLTQIKKRTRKIALLKSIGMTEDQVVSMLLWEGIYLLCYSMPVGVAAGFGVGWGAVQFLHKGMGMDVAFHMKPGLLVLGILLGCAALFVGMAVPTLKAMHVPLVGAIAISAKNRRKRASGSGSAKRAERRSTALRFLM